MVNHERRLLSLYTLVFFLLFTLAAFAYLTIIVPRAEAPSPVPSVTVQPLLP